MPLGKFTAPRKVGSALDRGFTPYGPQARLVRWEHDERGQIVPVYGEGSAPESGLREGDPYQTLDRIRERQKIREPDKMVDAYLKLFGREPRPGHNLNIPGVGLQEAAAQGPGPGPAKAGASIEDMLAGVEESPQGPAQVFDPGVPQKPDRSEEDELNAMIQLSKALSQIGEAPTTSEILLGLPGGKPLEIPESLRRESQALGARRRALEDRSALPEWDPNSPISKTARDTLTGSLGIEVPDTVSAAQIKEHFGSLGAISVQGQQLEEQRKQAGQLDKSTISRLSQMKTGLSRMKDLDSFMKKHGYRLGPIFSRFNKIAQQVGLDDAKASFQAAEIRSVFAKELYGTSGKQLSNREIDFMAETAAQAFQKKETFEMMLSTMRDRMLQNHNNLLQEFGAAGKNVKPHLLKGWNLGDDGTISWGGGTGPEKLKIPRSETAAIAGAKADGTPYEVIDG